MHVHMHRPTAAASAAAGLQAEAFGCEWEAALWGQTAQQLAGVQPCA